MKKPIRKTSKSLTKKPAKKVAKKAIKKATKKATKKPAKVQYGFNWHNLMTRDVDGAKRFYQAVVGWQTALQGPDYEVLMVDGQGIGGIMAQPAEASDTPPFWLGYIMVKNVDKHCAAIKKAGGSVHKGPWDVPNILRMAVVSEPLGAVFNVYHPLMDGSMKPHKRGTVGTVGWNELQTSDLAKSTAFYAKMFGWGKGETHDMGPEFGKYQVMKVKRHEHAGMMKRASFIPRDYWGFYFFVEGIDAGAKRITQHGGKITNGPMQVPTGDWIVSGQDPQGAHFSLMSETK